MTFSQQGHCPYFSNSGRIHHSAAISSVEKSDGTKSKLELWTASVETAAQISKQDILCIAFSKMIGPPLTSAQRFTDYHNWCTRTLKVNFQDNALKYLSTVMLPKLSPTSSKAQISYLRCPYIMPVNSY